MAAFGRVRFDRTAPDIRHAPRDGIAEVAFAGRSNAGKSSALNTLCGQRALARTSKTPGRTQALNFFELAPGYRLVDLPGYGYAKVPEAERRRWGREIERYLGARQELRGLVLVADIRRGLTTLDRQLLDWCAAGAIAVHVLLTKSDKLGRGQQSQALKSAQAALGRATTVQLFSATSRLGVDAARERIVELLLSPAQGA